MQILWSGRWQDGAAAAAGAGEDMEQLFSYLSRWNSTTKNMSASGLQYPSILCEVALRVNNNLEGREEHITEAVMFWNNRKIDVLPQYLTQRLQKVMWHVCVVCNHLFLVYSDRSG